MIFLRTLIIYTGGLTLTGALLAQTTTSTDPISASPSDAVPATETIPAVHSVQVGTGFDYSRGAYGFSEDTEVFSVPFLLTYNVEKWVFRASVPYLKIE